MGYPGRAWLEVLQTTVLSVFVSSKIDDTM